MENNFFAFSASIISSFGVPYDYGSVMHYGPYAFSWNGQRTIDPTVSQLSINFWFEFVDSHAAFVVLR